MATRSAPSREAVTPHSGPPVEVLAGIARRQIRNGRVVNVKIWPHGLEQPVILSDSRVRGTMRTGIVPPPEFVRPGVPRNLIEALHRSHAV